MKRKIWIAGIYIVAALVASGLFIYNQKNEEKAAKAAEQTEAENAQTTQKQYKKQLDKTLEQLNESEEKVSQLQAELDSIKAENAFLLAASGANSEEGENAEQKAAEDQNAEGENNEESQEATTYYSYTVNAPGGGLNLYTDKSGWDPVGTIPNQAKGKVLSMNESSDNRALISYEGKQYYASKSMLDFAEISKEEYDSLAD